MQKQHTEPGTQQALNIHLLCLTLESMSALFFEKERGYLFFYIVTSCSVLIILMPLALDSQPLPLQ